MAIPDCPTLHSSVDEESLIKLRLICKTFYCREPDMITKLFKSLIRPVLEYGNLI